MSVESGYDARMTVELELLSVRIRARLQDAGVFLGDEALAAVAADVLDDAVSVAVSWVEGR
ncbi:MAG: hypothetical protein ABIY52_18735 [Gemmatimonadaceae bacterium]